MNFTSVPGTGPPWGTGSVTNLVMNCGRCRELCPLEIPHALIMHYRQVEFGKIVGHILGVSLELPLIAFA
jgi:formate dehydrogenase (coenzyme F420) beta subunit